MEDKFYICKHDACQVAFPRYNTLNFHYLGKHKGEHAPPKAECEVAELPEGYILKLPKERGGTSPEKPPPEFVAAPKSVYKEAAEPSAILLKILSEFPGFDKGCVTEIMSWVEFKGVLHPMELSHLLNQLAGVPKGAATIIPQKYQLAMQKAALEGSAEVQMTLSGWNQMGPQLGQLGGMSPFTVGPYGGQPPAYGFPTPPWPGAAYPPGYRPEPPGYRPEPPPGKDDRLDRLETAVSTLIDRMTESEEEKKEATLNSRLDRLENAILNLSRPSEPGETTEKPDRVEELQDEIKKIREEQSQSRISTLERSIVELKGQLNAKTQEDLAAAKERIGKLEEALSEAIEEAKKPVTGRTEMDVVASTIDKVVDKVSDAGKDIKAVVMSGATREAFGPNRNPAQERKKAGEKLAATVENEAVLAGKERAFIERTSGA